MLKFLCRVVFGLADNSGLRRTRPWKSVPSGYVSETCVREPSLRLTSVVGVKRCLSYKSTCHVILLAKLHDMYLYKTDTFFHMNYYLMSVSKVALLHRFHCRLIKEGDTYGNLAFFFLNFPIKIIYCGCSLGAPRLIRVCTICSSQSFQILRVNSVIICFWLYGNCTSLSLVNIIMKHYGIMF